MLEGYESEMGIYDEAPPKRGQLGKLYDLARGTARAASNKMPKGILDTAYGPKSGRLSLMRRFGMAGDLYNLSAIGSDISDGNYRNAADNIAMSAAWHTANALSQKYALSTGLKYGVGRVAGYAAGIPGLLLTIGAPLAYDMYKSATGPPDMENYDAARMSLLTPRPHDASTLLQTADPEEYFEGEPEELLDEEDDYEFS